MEKLRVNGVEIDLLPAGIVGYDKQRTFKVSTDKTYQEVEEIFSDVTEITYITVNGDETKYLDCVKAVAITNHFNGTYSITVSVDATERKVVDLQRYTDDAICELTMLLSTMFMGGVEDVYSE